MRKILIALAILLGAASYSEAQGTLYQLPTPAPNAQVRVCPSPDNGYPCPSPASIFSDVALTQAVAQPVTLGSSGFFSFYIAAGTYVIQLSGPGYNSSNRTTVNIGGSGGITSVSSLPATCTPGVTAPVQLSVAPFGIYFCSATNVWARQGTSVIDALAYNVKADTKFCFGTNVSWTNASSTITTTANCPFTVADTGKKAFGTNGCCIQLASLAGTVLVPYGTLTFVSPTTATISTTSTGPCNTTACIFTWGSDDTAALTAAWNALVALPNCGTLQLPQGAMLTTGPQFQTTNAQACTGSGVPPGAVFGNGPNIHGWGIASSIIVPTPGFNFGACAGTGCFGGAIYGGYSDFGIYGAGQGNPGASAGLSIINFGTESQVLNVEIASWGGSDANLTGMTTSGRFYNVHSMGAGSTEVRVSGLTYMDACQFAYSNLGGMVVSNDLYSVDSYFGFNGAANAIAVNINSAATWFSVNDNIQDTGTNDIGIELSNAGARLQLSNSTVDVSAASTNSALWLNAAGSRASVSGTKLLGGSAGGSAIRNDGGTFFDGAGMPNTYTGSSSFSGTVGVTPTCPTVTGAGATGSCAAVAGSTNEKGTLRITVAGAGPAATGTVSITNAGTFSGATGTTPACVYTPALTGGGVWNARATMFLSTRSTTAPVITWDNNAAALTATTWDIDYTCVAR